MNFKIDEILDAVFFRESFELVFLVLPNSAYKIRCDAGIQSPVALACQNIDIELLIHKDLTGFPLSRE